MSMDLRAAYERDGYCLVRGLFDSAWVERLEADFDQIVTQLRRSGEDTNARWESVAADRDGEDAVITHTHNVQNYSSTWLQALLAPEFLDATQELLGPDIVLHHSKLFEKPPQDGAPFPMHQDWRYFPTAQDSMLAAVIHLSPATEDMGCLRIHPGSHRIGHRASTSGHVDWDDAAAFADFQNEFPRDEAIAVEAEPGDVVFFSSLTVHGSGPNQSDRARKTVLVQLFAGADELDPTSQHHVSGLVLRGRNHHATRATVAPRPER